MEILLRLALSYSFDWRPMLYMRSIPEALLETKNKIKVMVKRCLHHKTTLNSIFNKVHAHRTP